MNSTHWVRAIRDELQGMSLRRGAMNAALACLPNFSLVRVRTRILRFGGFGIGDRSVLFGAPHLNGDGNFAHRLRIGKDCAINVRVTFDLGADIIIGDRVNIGHEVMILTTNHKIGRSSQRAGPFSPQPVTIGDGAWICARATILPGVTIGAGAVVSAGAIVNKNVPPNCIVAGPFAQVVVPTLR